MGMELVPFNNAWCDSGTKLDLKALYRRGEVLAALPVRRHNDWLGKGFVYVTLATAEDVVAIKPELRARGVDLDALAKSYNRQGHFKIADYLAELGSQETSQLADLQAQVDKFGADSVVAMMRTQDPAYMLPAGIRVPKAAKGKAAEVSA